LTEILMEFTVREKKEKFLPNRCCLAAFGAEESSGLELIKLFMLILPNVHRGSSFLTSAAVRSSQVSRS